MLNVFDQISGKIKSLTQRLFQKGKFEKCPVSITLVHDSSNNGETYAKIKFCVKKPEEDVYKFCRNITNFPLLISQLISIEEDNEMQSYWKVKLLRSQKIIGWEMQITNEVPNQLICWEAVKNSFLESEGIMRFVDIQNNQLTEVCLLFSCKPLLKIGIYAKGFMNQKSANLLKKDIQKFIKVIEYDERLVQPHNLWI